MSEKPNIGSHLSVGLHFLEVAARVRYWEDATVNGVEDSAGTLIPFRSGDLWHITIRVADGQLIGWPSGTTADVHFKVCDAGEYWLLDEQRRRVRKWSGDYVPDAYLTPRGQSGWGDYVILKINPDGRINQWDPPALSPESWVELNPPTEKGQQ